MAGFEFERPGFREPYRLDCLPFPVPAGMGIFTWLYPGCALFAYAIRRRRVEPGPGFPGPAVSQPAGGGWAGADAAVIFSAHSRQSPRHLYYYPEMVRPLYAAFRLPDLC